METNRPTTGYYSLIQYCPDASRSEAANVGVVLFCPEMGFLDAKVSENHDRVVRFFGRNSFDPERMRFAKNALRSRLVVEHERFRSVEDLEQFIATRANDWRLTPLRPMRVTDPVGQLEDLFEELVEEQPEPVPVTARAVRAVTEIQRFRQLMKRPSLRDRVQRRVRVTLPNTTREVIVPYAYRNGAVNLVQPQAFPASPKGVDLALRLACEGDLLQKYPDPEGRDRKFIVIPYLPEGADQRREVEAIFGEYRIRTVGPEAVEAFVDEVEREAHGAAAGALDG